MRLKLALQFVAGILIVLFSLVLVARTLEIYGHSGQISMASGLFYDKLCYLGSYEIVVCSNILPPYETYLTILLILLAICMFAILRKR